MRKLCLFALPFCGAVFAACCGLPRIGLLVLGAAAVIPGIAAGCLKRLPACLVCLGLAFGLLWFQGYSLLFRAPAAALDGKTCAFSATITSWPRGTSYGGCSVEARLHLAGAPDAKILLYTNAEGADLSPGDTVSGSARFQLANVVRGETVSYYDARGILLRASAVGALEAGHPARPPVTVWPAYIARAMKQSAAAIFPADASAFMTALLTGDTSGLPDGDYTALRRAGAAHIVAVSGMHLSFFAGLLGFLTRRNRKIGTGLTILFLFLFAAVAEFTPSSLRAAFMISMTLLAPLLGRESDKATTLTAILFLLLLQNPFASLSVSLQLSFGAVAGIHLVTGPIYGTITRFLSSGGPWPRKLLRWVYRKLAANLSVTLGALLVTVPLSAYYFGTVSLISPLTNLLTLWAVSDSFLGGIVLTLFGIALPGAAAVPARLAAWLVRYILAAAHGLSALPFASVPIESIYLRLWLIVTYAILLLVLVRRYRRPVLPLCTAVSTFCAALLLTRLSLLSGALTITMLDVGQGQCILLYSGGYTALVDCGGNSGNAGDTAASYLQSLGISRLDLLILTHCHDDHANGVPELFARMEVSSLVLPALSEDESAYRGEILALAGDAGTDITLLSDNRTVSFGESTLTLYGPLGGGGANEEGLFVLATCGEFDMLITGDADSFVESLLVKYDHLPDIEVLVAGHHGSNASSSEVLLDAVTPEICLISSGYNTYGHPTPETLSRLAERDIDIYRTDGMGNLTIHCKGD